jgi:methionyl-tRNA synthetase
MAVKSSEFLREKPWGWNDAAQPLLATVIGAYEPLAVRLDPKLVAGLIDTKPAVAAVADGSASAPPVVAAPAPNATAAAAPAAPISIDEFSRTDLRVAKILQADLIDGADKLLRLRVSLGELGERQVFAGIRAAYDPASLVGRLTVVVANLAPRKMRFGTSEGMVLAAGPGGKELFLLSPDDGATAGMRIK